MKYSGLGPAVANRDYGMIIVLENNENIIIT
jgi:hypothetical protein